MDPLTLTLPKFPDCRILYPRTSVFKKVFENQKLGIERKRDMTESQKARFDSFVVGRRTGESVRMGLPSPTTSAIQAGTRSNTLRWGEALSMWPGITREYAFHSLLRNSETPRAIRLGNWIVSSLFSVDVFERETEHLSKQLPTKYHLMGMCLIAKPMIQV